MIRRAVQNMRQLIDDLLDLTRIDRGKVQLNFEIVDAHTLLQNALEICQPEIDRKHLRCSLSLGAQKVHMRADPARLQQIFWNLINNAVKFTSQGEIRAKAQPTVDRSSIEFEVTDTGIGIEKNKMDSIFEPFQQVDTSSHRSFSGLGLGLTVARRMVELIGGTLEITSEAGMGTRVLMKFPSQAKLAASLVTAQRKYG